MRKPSFASVDEVKALLLLDNAPAHPSDKSLVAHNGRIRVLYLPANTTSIIQPMDQGVIVSAKRMYRYTGKPLDHMGNNSSLSNLEVVSTVKMFLYS